MSSSTPRLDLPLLAAGQAQKHVTHNEALMTLDAVTQLSVIARVSTPPTSPSPSDRYIVAPPGTAAFAAHDHAVAEWRDGAWFFIEPAEGWCCWVAAEEAMRVFASGAWALTPVRQTDRLGIAATADNTNRLAVASPAALFNHAGTDSRLIINKAGTANTASLVLQNGFSGRAEIGLAGNDDLQVKTSPDGTTWQSAMALDPATGAARFPAGVEHGLTRKPIAQFMFTPGGVSQVSFIWFDRPRAQSRQVVLSARSGDLLTLTAADTDLVFHDFMRNVAFVRVWNISKSPPLPAWVKWNPAPNQLQVTDAAHISNWLSGETVVLGDQPGQPGVPANFTRGFAVDISPLLLNQLGGVFRQRGVMFRCLASGMGGRIAIYASANGVSGTFMGGNSLNDGQINQTTHVTATTELSPISNSNLVFVREDDAGPIQLSICGLMAVGVWA